MRRWRPGGRWPGTTPMSWFRTATGAGPPCPRRTAAWTRAPTCAALGPPRWIPPGATAPPAPWCRSRRARVSSCRCASSWKWSGRRPTKGAPVRAEAQATAPDTAVATGAAAAGQYRGPLEHRDGKPMRPDVARAYDRMAAAARAAGVPLVVVSGFRSDAEQAVLFARHPDPKWVAPPGRSLHRLATELDLGPKAAYGWLARNAGRFGFRQRYSWEPWHFGFVRGAGRLPSDTGAAPARGPRGRPTVRSGRRCPTGSRPATGEPCSWPRSAGTSGQSCSPRSSASRAGSIRTPARRRGRRGSRSSCRARLGTTDWRTPSTPTRRSTRRLA